MIPALHAALKPSLALFAQTYSKHRAVLERIEIFKGLDLFGKKQQAFEDLGVLHQLFKSLSVFPA